MKSGEALEGQSSRYDKLLIDFCYRVAYTHPTFSYRVACINPMLALQLTSVHLLLLPCRAHKKLRHLPPPYPQPTEKQFILMPVTHQLYYPVYLTV